MFHSQKLNNKINRLHEQCLRIKYNDSSSTFEPLLTKDNSTSIHNRISQVPATEMFKVYPEQASDILQDMSPINSQPEYNLRNKTHFVTRPIRTIYYGDNSLRYLGPKLWELIRSDIRDTKSVEVFKNRFKNWILNNCPCSLVKTYIQVGFIWSKRLFYMYLWFILFLLFAETFSRAFQNIYDGAYFWK